MVITEEDSKYLVELFKDKGFEDGYIKTLYVVSALGFDDEEGNQPTEKNLRNLANAIDRMVYDEKKNRLVGFIPPVKGNINVVQRKE